MGSLLHGFSKFNVKIVGTSRMSLFVESIQAWDQLLCRSESGVLLYHVTKQTRACLSDLELLVPLQWIKQWKTDFLNAVNPMCPSNRGLRNNWYCVTTGLKPVPPLWSGFVYDIGRITRKHIYLVCTGSKPLILCRECDKSLALGALIRGEIWSILQYSTSLQNTSYLPQN